MAVTWKKVAYEDDVVTKALFDAYTILMATADNTPLALTVNEQEVVGRLTGGAIDGIVIGIANDNMVQIDDAGAADNEFCKFTANGIEGRTYAEVMGDLSGAAAAAFSLNTQQLTNFAIHNIAAAANRPASPAVGSTVFQVDELAVYVCTVNV